MPSEADWEQALRGFLPQALSMAGRMCGDLPGAEDVVQNAVVKIWQARDDFRGQAEVKTWMTRILLNCCRDWRRDRAKHQNRDATLSPKNGLDQPMSADHPVAGLVAQPDLDPARQSLAAEESLRIRHAIADLPQRQREVVQLLIWQQCSVAEVADLLQISSQNVYASFHIAKQKLRLWLDADSPHREAKE